MDMHDGLHASNIHYSNGNVNSVRHFRDITRSFFSAARVSHSHKARSRPKLAMRVNGRLI